MDLTPYLAGAGIGILSWITFLLSDSPIGCSTAFTRTSGMIERAIRGDSVLEKPYYQKFVPEIDWEWMLVLGIVIGAFFTAMFLDEFSLIWVPSTFAAAFGRGIIRRLIVALIGGILVGLGARWAGGCTSGHGISGTLQLAVSSWIAILVFFGSGIITAFVLYRVIAL